MDCYGEESEGRGGCREWYKYNDWVNHEGIDIERIGKEEEGAGRDINRMMEWIVEEIDLEGRGKEEEGTGRERRGEEDIYI